MPTAHLFIDYQNVHFTAWECFTNYGTPVHESLIHPGRFADRVAEARIARDLPVCTIEEIHVYRGLPSRRNVPGQNARVQRQASNWTSDRRVRMNLRSLRYPRDWPARPAQEKGIDVLLAIQIAQASIERSADFIIVATRDTDLVPALELVQTIPEVTLELATWKGRSELKLSPQPRGVSLDRSSYMRSRDTASYA